MSITILVGMAGGFSNSTWRVPGQSSVSVPCQTRCFPPRLSIRYTAEMNPAPRDLYTVTLAGYTSTSKPMDSRWGRGESGSGRYALQEVPHTLTSGGPSAFWAPKQS